MKRICVALSIFCLFVASIFGYPECCFNGARDCSTDPFPSTNCCGQQESPQPVSHCNDSNQGGCHIQKFIQKRVKTNSTEDLSGKKNCEQKCFSLLPQIIADGPNRSIYLNPDNFVITTAPLELIDITAENAKLGDPIPSRGVDPSIASTVLRI